MNTKLTINKQINRNPITGLTRVNGFCVCLEIDGIPSVWNWVGTIEEAEAKGREWTTQKPVYKDVIWDL